MRSSRGDEARRVINEITDPCSIGAGEPIGLVDMGIIDSVTVDGSSVLVCLLPTFPGCLYVGHFENELKGRLATLDWCEDTRVEVVSAGDAIWTEDRIAPGARSRLERRRAAARARHLATAVSAR